MEFGSNSKRIEVNLEIHLKMVKNVRIRVLIGGCL